MHISTFPDYRTMSRVTADLLIRTVAENPQAGVIVATGSTPTLTYQLWVRDLIARNIPTNQLMIIKLDEWGGLPMNHPSTCETYIRKHIIEPLHLRENQFISFNSQPENPQTECARIAEEIKRLVQIDVCVLGIGKNGHLGFNEPSDHWSTDPFVTKLTSESLSHNMLQGDSRLVTFGITLGMTTITSAKKILVLASGKEKKSIVAETLRGPITPHCPASILQTLPNARLLLDAQAAGKLPT